MQGRPNDPKLIADLIGYHLGLCDEQEAAAVEHAFGKGESLIQKRADLARLLAPLDADDGLEPPAHLNDAILARVAQLGRTLPFKPLEPATEAGGPSRPMFNLRELLSLAAVIAIFVGVFVPGYQKARTNSQIINCANNMRMIGTGTQQYAETYGSPMPFVSAMPDNVSWAQGGGVQRVSNSQNAFELVRGRFVPATAFICPGRDEDFALQDPKSASLSDFPDPRNNSFGTNLITGPIQRQRFKPDSPIAADLTPLVDSQRHLVQDRPISLNSSSHGGIGQNVLKADIRVIFSRTPNAGLDSDDIYRVIGVQKYTGLERPQLRSDAFLVP